MHLISRLLGYIQPLVTYGLIALLEQRFILSVGASIYGGVVILATLVGAMLLRSSTVGQLSWRNVLASKFMPCSGLLGGGSLLKLCVSNLLGSLLFGFACFMVAGYLRRNDYAVVRIGEWTIACGLAWIVLLGMVLFLVHQYGKNYYAGASGFRKFLKLIATPAIALVVSIALVVAGLPFIALVVAMIPIAIVFIPMGSLLLIVLATKLSGKPIRWN